MAKKSTNTKKHVSERQGGNKASLIWVAKRTGKLWWAIAFISLVSSIISLSYVGFALISKQVLDIATGAVPGGDPVSQLITAVFVPIKASRLRLFGGPGIEGHDTQVTAMLKPPAFPLAFE